MDVTVLFTSSGYTKCIQLMCLIVSMATFFSLHSVEESDKSSSYYVTSMIVSPFLQTSFLLLLYIFGGLAIQKTLFELMVNSFYTVMVLVAAIILFVLSNDDSGAVAAGVFALFASMAYGFDTYLAVLNLSPSAGAEPTSAVVVSPDTPAETAWMPYPPQHLQPSPPQHPQPPLPQLPQVQPYAPPPAYSPPPSLAGAGIYTEANYGPGPNSNCNGGNVGPKRV